ncbi:hypothetical protein V8E55_010182 [Tylopilus felleus]
MSIVSVSYQRPVKVSPSRLIPPIAPPNVTTLAQHVSGWAPFNVLPSYQYPTFQYAWVASHQLLHFHDQQHSSPRSTLVLVLNACPQCQRRPKLPDHRFCSIACSQSAARSAPELKHLIPPHDRLHDVATQFMRQWKSGPCPKILAIYMITWTESSQRSFEQYRDTVETWGQFILKGKSSGNEAIPEHGSCVQSRRAR